MATNSGLMRHSVNVYRPGDSLDSDGQQTPAPVLVRSDVPCQITILSGRELESARKHIAEASARVRLFQSNAKPVTPGCWLQWGSRRLDVSHVGDPSEATDGVMAELLCVGEVTP